MRQDLQSRRARRQAAVAQRRTIRSADDGLQQRSADRDLWRLRLGQLRSPCRTNGVRHRETPIERPLRHIDVAGSGNRALRRAYAQGLAPDMACAETAIGIELIERRGIVVAPNVIVERRWSRQKSGEVDRHRAVFGLELEGSGEGPGEL